jgi:hypothetical protein
MIYLSGITKPCRIANFDDPDKEFVQAIHHSFTSFPQRRASLVRGRAARLIVIFRLLVHKNVEPAHCGPAQRL